MIRQFLVTGSYVTRGVYITEIITYILKYKMETQHLSLLYMTLIIGVHKDLLIETAYLCEKRKKSFDFANLSRQIFFYVILGVLNIKFINNHLQVLDNIPHFNSISLFFSERWVKKDIIISIAALNFIVMFLYGYYQAVWDKNLFYEEEKDENNEIKRKNE